MHPRRVLVVFSMVLMAGTSVFAQSKPERTGFWASVQVGYGLLDKFSDQEPHNEQGTLALALNLGGTLNRHLRLGAQINGWLVEASDLYDPAKGASISQIFVIAQVYPWSARGAFLKVGAGWAIYTNHHPDAFGSSGWGQTIAVGYDWPVSRRFSLTPAIDYSRGSLGDVDNVLVTVQNRRYRVFDFGIAVTYRLLVPSVAAPCCRNGHFLRHEVNGLHVDTR
jgi:hypothetical protein